MVSDYDWAIPYSDGPNVVGTGLPVAKSTEDVDNGTCSLAWLAEAFVAGGAASSRATVRVKIGLNGGKAYLFDRFPSRLSRSALDGACSQDMGGETGASVAKITPVSSFATSFRLGARQAPTNVHGVLPGLGFTGE
ncbi:hypothetical protein CABS01_03793 [Colletotrichum abscissum]|uniref:Uncharacterized protein n=1 Tax=Colletotrichum abscissum TaxID=1671311 RepID=A0A9P9XM03_9PEZI|nr:uncharacterized protein CABS01_03793 [Colletotrichum abscissum]KAI3556433.1 hypothetical protein CABS02_03293 [Colletotrichum abscissum]KAK1475516.1 hypothetical protein CABS01_03793 [Colletotrichum abscissum]